MEYRNYQIKYIDDIKINKSNLIISTMRSGKSAILAGIIDKYFKNKKVLIISGMRNVTLQLADYYEDHSYILSGKKYDPNHNLFLATFQTLIRRDIDLSTFDMIAIDEIHVRYNTKIVKEIRALNCTRIYMTGTPLTAKGTFLGKFDNIIEHTSIKQMVEDGFLAHTKFISKANLLDDDMKVQNGDYKDSEIERVIDKQAMVQWIVDDNLKYGWSTEHKTILYANSIKTATKIHKALNDNENIKIVHSRLTSKQIDETMNWFHTCKAGIIINVRQLTIGVDIPTADTIINVTPTKILSLFLQTAFRASTKYGDKEAIYYDYTGVLRVFNPYYKDWTGKKIKLTCRDQCKEFPENSIARHMCIQGCKIPEEQFMICTTTPSYTFTEDPYKSRYTVKGTPCNQGFPFYEWKYYTESPKDRIGILIKHKKCPGCGCESSYELKTIIQPSQTIEMYNHEIDSNNILFIYNKAHRKGLMIIDDLKAKNYKYKTCSSQTEVYEYALKIFKNRTFTLNSNIELSKLSNSIVSKNLDNFVDLIDWDKEDQKIMRKIITSILQKKVKAYKMKKGYVYYFKKLINPANERLVMKKLNTIKDKYELIKFKNQLER